MDIQRMKQYWCQNATLKWSTAESLYTSKKYVDSLFFYHLAIESLLKALVVQELQQPAPYTHDLVRLAEIAKLDLNKKQTTILQDITQYNLESRYPDEKFEFYKRATADFTKKALKDIKTIRLWLDSNLQ